MSMRSVDAECQVRVTTAYIIDDMAGEGDA